MQLWIVEHFLDNDIDCETKQHKDDFYFLIIRSRDVSEWWWWWWEVFLFRKVINVSGYLFIDHVSWQHNQKYGILRALC